MYIVKAAYKENTNGWAEYKETKSILTAIYLFIKYKIRYDTVKAVYFNE